MPALPAFVQFKSDPTKHYDGILPYEGPLSSFQIAHDIIWEFTNISPVGGLSAGRGTGTFEFQLLRPGDDVPLFWQAVTMSFNWVAMGLGGFLNSGLDLFTWSFYKDQIDTFLVNGQPTDKHPTTPDPNNAGWSYTVGGTPLSEFGTAIPGGGPPSGNGVGIRGGIIESFWQGPLYNRNISLPGLAGLDIKRDQWQAKIARLPLWHVRAVAGESEMDAFMHDFGFICKAFAESGNSYFSIGETFGGQEPRGFIGEGDQPSIEQDNAGVIYGHVSGLTGVKVYDSTNTGITWKPVKIYKDATTTEEEELFAWGTGFNMPRIIRMPDGSRGTVAQKNGQIYFKTSRDNFQGIVVVGPAKSGEDYEVVIGDDGVLYVEAAGHQAYFSTSSGAFWEASPPPEAAAPA